MGRGMGQVYRFRGTQAAPGPRALAPAPQPIKKEPL